MLLSKLIMSFLLLTGVGARAELNPGKYQIDTKVYQAIANKLQLECPKMFARESIEVTSSIYTYHGNEVFEYVVGIVGRGYVVNDPHWDMSFNVVYDMHLNEVISIANSNYGDCW